MSSLVVSTSTVIYDPTHMAHTFPRTALLSRLIQCAIDVYSTHTFTSEIEFLSFEFLENFQELLQKSYELCGNIVLILSSA
jgi:hypothetical protein